MLAVVKAITGGKGSNVFLFADTATLASTIDVLSLDWITGKNGSTPLVSC